MYFEVLWNSQCQRTGSIACRVCLPVRATAACLSMKKAECAEESECEEEEIKKGIPSEIAMT